MFLAYFGVVLISPARRLGPICFRSSFRYRHNAKRANRSVGVRSSALPTCQIARRNGSRGGLRACYYPHFAGVVGWGQVEWLSAASGGQEVSLRPASLKDGE